jgi:prophage regulatory protein
MNRLSREIVESKQVLFQGDKEASSTADEVIFLRLPKVKALTGLSKSSLYELIRDNNFPAPIHLGPRTVAWVSSEVRQWAAERISTSRAAASQMSSRRMPQRALGEAWASSKRYA